MNENDERHERIKDDLAAYAVGGLDPQATARVEEHLQGCPDCRRLLREYFAVVELLPLAVSPALPSAAGREALRERLWSGRQHHRQPARAGWWPSRLRLQVWAPVAALLLIFAGLGLHWIGSAGSSPSTTQALSARDDVRVVQLVGPPLAPTAGGQLFMTADLSQAGINVRGLPPLPADRSYQVWFYGPGGTWVSGGTFGVDREGRADVIVRLPVALPSYDGCWVTEEPVGGSSAPSGQPILTAIEP